MKDCSLPGSVSIIGGLLNLHALKPTPRSLIASGPVSSSFQRIHSSLMFWSPSACAAGGSGHCRMWAVVSFSCLQCGHAADACFPYLCIMWLIVQKPVVNFVFIQQHFKLSCQLHYLYGLPVNGLDSHTLEACFV